MQRHRSRAGWLLPVLTGLFAVLVKAHAHSTAPGMNDVVNGVLHPFLTPPHLLILLASGVLIGQHFEKHFSPAIGVFASFSAAALFFTMTKWITGVPSAVLIGIALAFASLVAFEKRLSPFACRALFAVAAIGIGLDSGLETGTPMQAFKTLLGTWTGLQLGLTNFAFYTSLAAEKNQKWLSIGLRVIGSWIVAISLLMLAFALRK